MSPVSAKMAKPRTMSSTFSWDTAWSIPVRAGLTVRSGWEITRRDIDGDKRVLSGDCGHHKSGARVDIGADEFRCA
jgi:hypothetical protein